MSVELRDENGNAESESVDGTVLARLIPALDDRSSDLLRFVDPYGDTVFNRQQARIFAAELRSHAQVEHDVSRLDAIQTILELADRCAEEVHTYLWFVGD